MPSAKELAKALAYQGEIRNQPRNRFLGGVADFLAPVSEFADRDKLPESIPLLGGMSFADLSGLKGTESLVRDMSHGKSPVRGATLNTAKVDPRLLDLAAVSGAMIPVGKALGKAALREGARQIETGTGVLGRNVIDPRQPIITYHGSPHTFPPTANNPLGEFDPMKVGTGEGAQAYGVGAGYLAEAPAVAKGYRQTEGMYKRVTGGMTNKEEFIADHLSQGRPETSILDLYAQKYGGSFDDAMKDLINVKQMYGTGNLYKVDLPDEHVAKMLDWDKPLSEQHPSVQSALAKLDPDIYHPKGDEYSPDEVGAEIYLRMANSPLAKNQSDASEVMRNAGITGIRYLDAASRDAGKGTSNFVVFDPKHMNILERNGVGGAMMQRPKTEFEILHDTAQRNAALPVEQGGLGLPANNTYIDRANAPGMFPTDAYHATNVEFDSFDPSKTKFVNGVFSSTDPSGASAYVEAKNAGLPTKHEGGFVMPLRINNEKSVTPEYFNLNNIRSGLAEGNNVVGGDVVVIPDAKNIRSRFAAFDPMRRHEADILAGVGVGGMLDPQAIAEALRQQDRK